MVRSRWDCKQYVSLAERGNDKTNSPERQLTRAEPARVEADTRA